MKKLLILAAVTLAFVSCQNGPSAKYEGKDISEHVIILRNKETKEAFFRINQKANWILYAGPTVEEIDFSKPFIGGDQDGIFKLDVPRDQRFYFQLITDDSKAILSESLLPMAGAYNFRDLGGIRTTDGHYVKWGKIFRSDDLNNLTEDDLNYLNTIPLISIVDFRSEDEINAAEDKRPSLLKNYYKLSIKPGNLSMETILTSEDFAENQVDSLMMSLNKELVSNPEYIAQYRDFFRILQNANKVPLVFHCSAGKDRTGMGAALILFALGVDEQTILENYMLSNVYLDKKYAELKVKYPKIKSMFEVKPEFLQAGVNEIKTKYGSVEEFLTFELDVDIDRFREMYLYK